MDRRPSTEQKKVSFTLDELYKELTMAYLHGNTDWPQVSVVESVLIASFFLQNRKEKVESVDMNIEQYLLMGFTPAKSTEMIAQAMNAIHLKHDVSHKTAVKKRDSDEEVKENRLVGLFNGSIHQGLDTLLQVATFLDQQHREQTTVEYTNRSQVLPSLKLVDLIMDFKTWARMTKEQNVEQLQTIYAVASTYFKSREAHDLSREYIRLLVELGDGGRSVNQQRPPYIALCEGLARAYRGKLDSEFMHSPTFTRILNTLLRKSHFTPESLAKVLEA